MSNIRGFKTPINITGKLCDLQSTAHKLGYSLHSQSECKALYDNETIQITMKYKKGDIWAEIFIVDSPINGRKCSLIMDRDA